MQTPGSSFLHERNPNLHTSVEVESVARYLRAGGEIIPNEPVDKISAYLGFLANREYVNDGILTGDQRSIDRQIEAHIIKAEDVTGGYYELQRRIAREQGHGDVEITAEMRTNITEAAQTEQRAGLGKWVEYLVGHDGGYPDWFKNYTWTSVTEMGNYNKEKREFQKRSKGTVAPYPELNREALAYVYDALNKSRVQGEQVDGVANNAELQKLLENGNFAKLYAHAILEATPASQELRNEIRGSWTKYDKTDDHRTALRLSGSLQGHGTGWCTAGESTASTQLKGGDFYVYYSRDEEGKDTVPRVAIRMEDGEVAEVRGVNVAQELEPIMTDTTVERLKDLPGGEEYILKAEDMKRLTLLEKKIAANSEEDLTSEEIRFLYELDHEIQGFGYNSDPRIAEIRSKRGDRDKPELVGMMPESIREQLHTAYSAYRTVANNLDRSERGIFARSREVAAPPQELESLFASKDKEWQANGTYAYLAERLIKDGAHFTLVATPNIAVSQAQIVALARGFGKQLSQPVHLSRSYYAKSKHSNPEWSGNKGDAPIRLSLISSKKDSEMTYKPVNEQVRMLRERQALRPALGVRVPSVLDAVTYWYRLRAGGDKFDDNKASNKTFITHFDLEPVTRANGYVSVPFSHIHDYSGPMFATVSLDEEVPARLAVG